MKPKRSQRPRGANWQGNSVRIVDNLTLTQANPTSCVSSSAKNQPLAGKVFYLDVPSNRKAEALESDIKHLGGTVEKFFSKEIKYLVSNKREARYVQYLSQDSPVPSPGSGQSSPHPRSNSHRPGSHGDNNKSRSQGQTDTCITSRGKSLVERVVKEQERVQMNKILSNALEWGVKILYIDDIMAYVQRRKKIVRGQCPSTPAVKAHVKVGSSAKQGLQKCKDGKISKPFVKVEDSSRHYCPIFFTMPNMPEFNLRSVPPCTPFCGEDKYPPGNKQEGQRVAKVSASEERAPGRKKNRDKKRGGYCECCMIRYENLTMHLQSECHKTFSKSNAYEVVDRQISMLRWHLIHIKTKVKRPKCSDSSVHVPGPCEKTEPRHKGDLSTTETINEEQHQTVKGESDSGHAGKNKFAPVTAPLIRRKGGRRNCDTYSEHKSLAHKWPRRQNSLTSCTEKAEPAQIPEPKMENASSRGECLISFPCEVTYMDSVDQRFNKDMESFPSHCYNLHTQNDCSESLNTVTKQQEDSAANKDLFHFESVQDGSFLPDKITGNYASKNTEWKLPLESIPSVQKILRKIRISKRKRRKVDRHDTHVPENSMLKLWELFQSSDDMDVEFNGFKDEEIIVP